MKTLVIQLARLGDIYQTWPVLRALKRIGPGDEIHVLTRRRFGSALEGCEAVDRHWTLDSKDIFSHLVDEIPDLEGALAKIDRLCGELKSQGFDRVINLSFSPVSSFLTEAIATEATEVKGYTRFKDGYLDIPDDGSAYFYAQVGPERANRLHVTDLFAFVAGVELTEADWTPYQPNPAVYEKYGIKSGSVVLHVGASQSGKTLSWMKWAPIVKGLLSARDIDVVLIGSKEEVEIADRICAGAGDRKPLNLVGRTTLGELFDIIGSSRLMIGGDSGPVHVASLTSTPVLNISFPMVSHWETGPRSAGSRIVVIDDEGALPSDSVVREALSMLDGQNGILETYQVLGPLKPYEASSESDHEFQWDLVRGLYLGEALPQAPSEIFLEGMRRLSEVNQLALEQIAIVRTQPGNRAAGGILDRADEIIEQIGRMVPDLGPLVRWFQTERLRIGPMPVDQLTTATENVHRRLQEVIELYRPSAGQPSVDQSGSASV